MKSRYLQFMEDAGGFLELRVDTKDEPVEVTDFAAMLTSIASQYDDFLRDSYGIPDAESRFYIKELRKGSLIVHFAAATIGMMDQAIILKQFFDITRGHVQAFIGGTERPARVREKGKQLADMVRAVAESEDGNLALAYRETTEADGSSDIAMVVTKQDANDILRRFALDERPAIQNEEEPVTIEEPKRVLMRLYQHNQDPNVASKKQRTGHKAIIRDFDIEPKILTYETEELADELAEIVGGNPYQDIVFDASVIRVEEKGKLRVYRLVEIHNWYREEDEE